MMRPVSLEHITLLDGIYKDASEAVHKALLRLDPDRLLFHPRAEAGIKNETEPMLDLPPFNFGAGAGHYMSSASLMFALTGDERLKTRVEYMVKSLREVQSANGSGYCGGVVDGKRGFDKLRENIVEDVHFSGFNGIGAVPWYNMHKIYQGFVDAYHYGKVEPAKEALSELCHWTYDVLKNLSEENVQKMISVEYGGMQEALLSAYEILKDEKIMFAAKIFTDKQILGDLKENKNILPRRHANTMIPKFTGFAKYHSLTGDKNYIAASENFWDMVVNTQTFINGGNSYDEHFLNEDEFESVIMSPKGPECCNEYNMSKLTGYLFEENKESKYMDYYEKIILNHMLVSINPINGGRAYFTSIAPMSFRATIDDSPTCCGFTMLEFVSRAHELIYTYDNNALYINQFIASKVKLENGMIITQNTEFPYDNVSNITFNMEKPTQMDLYIRKPIWSKEISVTINNKKIDFILENGYLRISYSFKNNDLVKISLDMEVQFEYLPHCKKYGAFKYGPVALAVNHGKTNFTDFQRTGQLGRGEYGNPLNWPIFEEKYENMEVVNSGSLNFKLKSYNRYYQLKPFFEMHDERYTIYAPIMNSFDNTIEKAKRQKLNIKKPNNTIDHISFADVYDRHNLVFEAECSHDEITYNKLCIVEAGEILWDMIYKGKSKLESTLKVDSQQQNTLRIDYFLYNYDAQFTITVDDKLLCQEKVNEITNPREYATRMYPIPNELTANKDEVRIRIETRESRGPAVYSMSIISPCEL